MKPSHQKNKALHSTIARPNLLFIFADQMRGFDMNCAGNAQVHTPNMDRLAREGALVPNTFANCPVCGPSRAVLLTGLLPPRNCVVANDLPLPENVPAIGDFLKAAGYRTGYIGKWHLDGVPRDKFTPPGPRRQGFDFWAAANCRHDYENVRYFRDTPESITPPGYEPQVQTDIALEFLHVSDERPFCLYLSWGPPHDPYHQVPAEYRALYDPATLQLRPNVVENPENALANGLDCRTTTANYYAAISALDAQLGRLLDDLDTRGLTENTVVVFTSDHGDMLWSHGRLKKQLPYEEAIHLPFLMRWPGQVPAGSRPQTLLAVADFTPSLLGLLEVDTNALFDGIDLSPALRGTHQSGPNAVLLMEMVTTDEGLLQGVEPWRGLRTRTHTYARRADRQAWLLFDNIADQFQTNNLAEDAASACLLGELDELLDLLLARARDADLSWDATLRSMNLVDDWNARERELHGEQGRFL